MTLNESFRPTLLLACLALAASFSKAAPGPDSTPDIEDARRNAEAIQRAVAALPPACTLGTAPATAQGSWLNAPKSMPEPGHPHTFLHLFDAATMTGAVRVALNPAALAELEKVEFRDADGKWTDAGPLTVREAPAGCDYVWLQQDLGGARRIDALRHTFRPSAEPLTLANAGLFQSDR